MIDTEINIHVECGGIVPPEGVTMVPDDGELCACAENGVEAIDLDIVIEHYIIALRWSETDENGHAFDGEELGDLELSDAASAEIRTDVNSFMLSNQADCHAFVEALGLEQLGHDIALTRNGHGAGFWDRGLHELGERLSEAARPMGEQHLIVGDDGYVYTI